MLQFESRREKSAYFHTLSSVLFLLRGKSIVVDLKNETIVCGILDEVDGYMNVSLRKVVFVDEKGVQRMFDQFYVPKRKIRFVHLPKLEAPIVSLLEAQFAGPSTRPRTTKDTPKSFKQLRSHRYQQEILREIRTTAEENKKCNNSNKTDV
ncbi:U7 snRNA-associated Sm-like protein LSm10 [Phlebotomus argentipes]|uniref:U7 snRNA-associated Sm-like protein LSm10 n=1 Tax=Phlebotomus argentipes TaxID=94469 RepID=UPI0028929AD3|nr:U7 snRNA-associated Sm-like protein LSm10 [Phlebotomus argentipes]